MGRYFAILFMVSVSLTLYGRDSISVILFLLDDCVICRDYTPQIRDLHKEYGSEVSFVGFFPNFSSKLDKIQRYRETFDIEFPLKTDYYKIQALKYGVEVMPEVVVYNHSTNTPLYQGRIDNTYERLGRRRKVTTSSELIQVLESIITDEPYQGPKKTESVGCYINYTDIISEHKN